MGPAPEAAARLVGRGADPGPVLSEREIEVVRLLAQGHSNRAIASPSSSARPCGSGCSNSAPVSSPDAVRARTGGQRGHAHQGDRQQVGRR